MDTKEDRVTESVNQRETYIAPQMAILGKVEDLTRGVATTGTDNLVTGTA